jgi:hypothetical protein
MQHEWERLEIQFFLDTLKGRDHLEGQVLDGKIILECILGKYGGRVWTGFI